MAITIEQPVAATPDTSRRGADARRMLPSLRETRAMRFASAVSIAGRIVVGYKLLSLRRGALGEERYEARLSARHAKNAQSIYDGVLRLQGLMIKVGQTIGSRPDLFPEEYVRVLSRLQDRVPPRPFSEMRPHIERELGAPLGRVFAEFDETPVAAASLAQVYRARLHDGRDVAVKVVYPRMDSLLKADLRILRTLIWLESKFFGFPLEPVYREIEANVPHEIDMLHEAASMREIAARLAYRPDVVIPGVIWEHTTRRVLTMEYLDGIKLSEIGRLQGAGIDIQRVYTLLLEVYFEQMMRHGHFHADPHPGNLFAMSGDRLGLVDFGLTKRFTPAFQAAFRSMTQAIFTRDNERLIGAMREAGFRTRGEGTETFVAIAQFFQAMSDPDTYRDKEVMDAVTDAWMRALKRNPMVQMPGEIALPMRVFGLLFGLGATVGGGVELAKTAVADAALKYTGDPVTAATTN